MENFYQKMSGYSLYFEIIRKKIFKLGIIFFVFFIVGFIEAGNIVKYVINLFKLQNVNIVTSSPFQFLDLSTKIGVGVGLLVVVPLVLYYTYNFLKDGLTKKEKNWFFVFLLLGFILFALGFLYCFALLYFYLNSISKIGISFGINNVWDVNSFLSQIFIASIFFGLVFQFPIILHFLIRINLLKVDYLKKKRRIAFALIFIFVGFLPPPDILSTVIEAIPLILMYEIVVRINSSYRPDTIISEIAILEEETKEEEAVQIDNKSLL